MATNTSLTIFQNILNHEAPWYILQHTKEMAAILDSGPLWPITLGHTLVIPTQPIDHIVDLPSDLAIQLLETSKEISYILNSIHGYSVWLVTGFEVPHCHFHVIPDPNNNLLGKHIITHIPLINELNTTEEKIGEENGVVWYRIPTDTEGDYYLIQYPQDANWAQYKSVIKAYKTIRWQHSSEDRRLWLIQETKDTNNRLHVMPIHRGDITIQNRIGPQDNEIMNQITQIVQSKARSLD